MAFPIDQVYEDEDLQGPGWLIFFTETIRVIPARGGDGSANIAKNTFLQHQELGLEEDDIIDLVTLLLLLDIIE